MKSIRDLSIKGKLRGINVVTGAAGLLLTFSAFLVYDYRAARETTRERLESLAQVVANQSTAVVGFNDAKSADEVLYALAGEPRIVSAALYGRDGRRLATFVRRNASALVAPPEKPLADGSAFRHDRLDVTRPILSEGERLGTVHVSSDLSELDRRLHLNVVIMLAALLGSSLVALLLCLRLEGSILLPIFRLAGTMRSVSRTKDFTLRAAVEARDETGALVDGFNEMLSEIEKRDEALRLAHANLERRVAERTLELSNANEALARENEERAKAERVSRESEERYRQLIDLSPDAIFMQANGLIILANPAAIRLLRASKPADLLARPLLDFVVPEQRPAAAEESRLLLEEGKSLPPQERRYARLDGTWVDVETASTSPRVDGRPALLCVVRDISQRKEVERLKDEFVSTVSHELRTPLTSIRGSLGLLAGGVFGVLPPAAVPILEIANTNCERLVRLINDILDIEKIEAGKMEFRMKPVHLAPLLESAIEASRGYAESMGVRLVLEETVRDARVSADSDRILQVMANLLSNAVKFSPSPSTVEVSLRRHEGRLRVSVRDHGSGIPEAFRARIFQKFAQADGSNTRKKGGTGLGLSICKIIMERMSGTIGFDSDLGVGATFYIELLEVAAAVPPLNVSALKGPSILVVEDDPDVALLLSLMLQHGGYQSEIARDAAEARSKLTEGRHAAVTLDIMLSDESGIAFLREIRRAEATRELPVIIVSAKADAARRQLEGHALMVVDWIDKPIEQERLMAAIAAAVRRPLSERARILHVEDDASVLELMRADVSEFADTAGARSLGEARSLLASAAYDLVILDVALPDGSGLDLLPLCVDGRRRPIPVLVYSAYDIATRAGLEDRIQGVLVKSRVSNEELRVAVQTALRSCPDGGKSSTVQNGTVVSETHP